MERNRVGFKNHFHIMVFLKCGKNIVYFCCALLTEIETMRMSRRVYYDDVIRIPFHNGSQVAKPPTALLFRKKLYFRDD